MISGGIMMAYSSQMASVFAEMSMSLKNTDRQIDEIEIVFLFFLFNDI